MRRHRAVPLCLFTLILSALACNLAEPPTPTFIPPPTFTVPPPIVPSTLTPSPETPQPTPAQTEEAITPSIPVDASIAPCLDQVDYDRLLITVGQLVSFYTRFVNADPNSATTGIGGAGEWITNQFQLIEQEARAGAVPFVILPHTFQLTWRGLTTTQTNVLAYLPGSGDRANEVIIVSANYDSVGESPDPTVPAPGADDNASGVAVMLECARIMAQSRHRATVVFVAFSAKETGRQGSQAFLRDVVQGSPPLDVRAVINVDTVGAQVSHEGEVIGDRVRVFSAPPNESASRQLARTIHLVASSYVPDFWVDVQPMVDREGGGGDHMTFSDADYPAVRLIEAAEDPTRTNSGRDTADSVSSRYMARVTRVVLATLLVLADGPAPPPDIALSRSTTDPNAQTLRWTASPNAVGYLVALRSANSLTYDRWFQVGAPNVFAWDSDAFAGMGYLAIAAVDTNGRQGPFSPEIPISQ